MITIKTDNLKTNTEVINREMYPEEIEMLAKEREKPAFNYLRNRYGSEEWLQYLRANP